MVSRPAFHGRGIGMGIAMIFGPFVRFLGLLDFYSIVPFRLWSLTEIVNFPSSPICFTISLYLPEAVF